jgi:hypothetical protein
VTAEIIDMNELRAVCVSLGGCWRHYLITGQVDPVALDQALELAARLGRVGGSTGAALRFLVSGRHDLDLGDVEVGDALAIVTAAGFAPGLCPIRTTAARATPLGVRLPGSPATWPA